MAFTLTAHGVTHPGHVRKINEDALFCDAGLGLFVVADGMGGHNAGEVASRLAVEAITGFLAPSRDGEDFTWPYGLDPESVVSRQPADDGHQAGQPPRLQGRREPRRVHRPRHDGRRGAGRRRPVIVLGRRRQPHLLSMPTASSSS